MNFVFGFLLIGVNLYYFMKYPDRGLCMFVVLMSVSPVINIFGYSMGYDLVFFPFILLLVLVKKIRNVRLFKFNKMEMCLYLWYVVLLFSTFIAVFVIQDKVVNVVSLIGTLRYIILYGILLRQPVIQKYFISIFRGIVYANVLAVIVEYVLMQTTSPAVATRIWLMLYGTIGKSGSLKQILETGAYGRLYGASASSSIVGMICIAGLAIFLTEYKMEKNWKSIVSILACLFCGIVSSTKRFYLGILVIMVYVFVLYITHQEGEKKKLSFKFPMLIILSVSAMLYFISAFRSTLNIDYYLNYLLRFNISGAFSSRFSEHGAVSSMRNAIGDNLLLGVGDVTISGINATDSQLYVVLYRTGIVGLLLFAGLFIETLKNVLRSKEILKCFIWGLICFEFLISTQFFSTIGILLFSYISYRKRPELLERSLDNERSNSVNLYANV